MSALNRGGVEEIQLTGKPPPADHRALRLGAGKPARPRWLRRAAYVAAVAAVLAFFWTQHDAERASQKPEAPALAPDSKADAKTVSEAFPAPAAEPLARSSPPVDSPAK